MPLRWRKRRVGMVFGRLVRIEGKRGRDVLRSCTFSATMSPAPEASGSADRSRSSGYCGLMLLLLAVFVNQDGCPPWTDHCGSVRTEERCPRTFVSMLRTGEKAHHHLGFNGSGALLKFNRSAVLKNWPAFFQERPGCVHRTGARLAAGAGFIAGVQTNNRRRSTGVTLVSP